MYKVGDVVRIKTDIEHDVGYAGNFGVICDVTHWSTTEFRKHIEKPSYWSDYYVLAYDSRAKRIWECGFAEESLEPQGYEIMPFLQGLQHWMNSQHSLKTGMKLKSEKFGKHYDYWKIKKEKGAEKAAK